MTNRSHVPLPAMQQAALIVLRTLIGWHFLYEGYYKFKLPGWSADGTHLGAWTSAGYLRATTGPLAWLFHQMLDAGWAGWLDWSVKISLMLIGLSLMLGLFTRAGCWGAILLLSLFYVLMIPLDGTQQPGSEGAYLIVNKTLIEAAAVGVVLAFNTGEIAGLDLLFSHRKDQQPANPSVGVAN